MSEKANEERIAKGGYCFDCLIAFSDETRADAHYAMTGHMIGWPMEAVNWPEATDEQVWPASHE